jgi:hypothetical protein
MSVALHRKDGDGGNVSKLVREAYKCVFLLDLVQKHYRGGAEPTNRGRARQVEVVMVKFIVW